MVAETVFNEPAHTFKTRSLGGIDRFLNGLRPETPPGYFRDRRTFENHLLTTEIPEQKTAAIILLDVRSMGRLEEKVGNTHLEGVKREIENWAEDKFCYLFSKEESDEVLVFVISENENEIKEEVSNLNNQIAQTASNEVVELLEIKGTPMPVISQGIVIIKGDGRALNLGSLGIRLAEADMLLRNAKKDNRFALISLDETSPESDKPRNLSQISMLPKFSGRQVGPWQETDHQFSGQELTIKNIYLPPEVCTSNSEAQEVLKKYIKKEGLPGIFFRIANFRAINRISHDFGNQVLGEISQEIIDGLNHPIIIKIGTDFLVFFPEGQEPKENDLIETQKILADKLKALVDQRIPKNIVSLSSFRLRANLISQEDKEKFSFSLEQTLHHDQDK